MVLPKKDRTIAERYKSQRNTLIWSKADPHELNEKESDYIYKTSSLTLKRRLELSGFNRAVLEQEFQQCIAETISTFEELGSYDEAWIGGRTIQTSILRTTTLSDWLSSLKIAVNEGITEWRWEENKNKFTDPLLTFMFEGEFFWNEGVAHITGFPCKTLECMAIAMLEIFPEEVQCVLDITDLIDGGWTDSFEDLIEYQKDFTTFYENFNVAIQDTKSLLELSPGNPTLAKLLYANAVTALETYLSDTIKKQVLTREATKRKFVQTNDTFKEKIPTQDIYRKLEAINDEIIEAIDMMSFHNIDKVISLYKAVLDTHFPAKHLSELKSVIAIRHDIVHRNGKTLKGETVKIDEAKVISVIDLIDSTIRHIDTQIKDGLLDDEDELSVTDI